MTWSWVRRRRSLRKRGSKEKGKVVQERDGPRFDAVRALSFSDPSFARRKARIRRIEEHADMAQSPFLARISPLPYFLTSSEISAAQRRARSSHRAARATPARQGAWSSVRRRRSLRKRGSKEKGKVV